MEINFETLYGAMKVSLHITYGKTSRAFKVKCYGFLSSSSFCVPHIIIFIY